MIFKKRNEETNRTWKHCQLEERVTRAQTYVFVISFFICECCDLFLFLSFEGFPCHNRWHIFPHHIFMGHIISRKTIDT